MQIPQAELNVPLRVSFEEAFAALSVLPRLFIEPDGSFVWVSSDAAEPTWQVDGTLYDRNGRLLYAELKGNCTQQPFAKLLEALGAAGSETIVQLVRHAVILDTAEFTYQFLDK